MDGVVVRLDFDHSPTVMGEIMVEVIAWFKLQTGREPTWYLLPVEMVLEVWFSTVELAVQFKLAFSQYLDVSPPPT